MGTKGIDLSYDPFCKKTTQCNGWYLTIYGEKGTIKVVYCRQGPHFIFQRWYQEISIKQVTFKKAFIINHASETIMLYIMQNMNWSENIEQTFNPNHNRLHII